MMTQGAELTSAEKKVARQVPGLLTPTLTQARSLFKDEHSLFHGEVIRKRGMFHMLDQASVALDARGYSDRKKHEALRRTLYDFFFGDLNDRAQTTVPMYHGTPADFEADMRRVQLACDDVEAIYPYLLSYLPSEAMIKGDRLRLHERLTRPGSVTTHDPLELIAMMRQRSDPMLELYARHKLVLAQMAFEARRDGYATEVLEHESRVIERFLSHRLFCEPEGEEVSIVAELDPHNGYRCTRWSIVEAGTPTPEPRDGLFVLHGVMRYQVRLAGGRRIPVFFSVRPKRHMLIKSIHKEIRFLPLIGIGDAVAMMFVTDDHDDFQELYREWRPVLVPCPGQVCDQASSLSVFRMGQERLDGKNPHSSYDYKATKYNARMADRITEVQFVPTRSWIDAKCSHSDVNHGWYKLSKLLELVFPILFPERLVGVPWGSKALFEQCIQHVLAHPERFAV